MHQQARLETELGQLGRLVRVPRIRLGAALAIALAAAFVVWLLVRGDAPSTTANPSVSGRPPASNPIQRTAGTGPVAASVQDLKTFAAAIGHPIYWAGPKPGATYELTQTRVGQVFIRYLPPGVKVGVRKPFLTIATYPYPNALSALKALAKSQGGEIKVGGGGIALVDQAYPKSVHLAYPGSNFQVEVFSPSPAVSRQVVVSGQVAAIG